MRELIKSPVLVKRVRHVVGENQRTRQAVEALEIGDVKALGALMNASHRSLRDNHQVSCEEMDILVEEAQKIEGTLGSRMMGAGYGGCTISIVEESAVEAFIQKVGENYKTRTGRTAEFYVVETGNGAMRL